MYTGRDMAAAHKHLNIDERQWEAFMEIFNDVCGEFKLPAEDIDDLNALMISMMDECVVWPGERPRPDPGMPRPSGNSLYARCGGVYPIALFCDRLVDALLSDERVEIPVDGQKRNEASLKYLMTELICKSAGGPEVITCAEAEETRLLVPRAAWPIVVLTANLAADHLPNGVRDALIRLIEQTKPSIIDPHSQDGPLPGGAASRRAAVVKSKEDSAAGGKLLSKAVINARHASGGASVAARKRVFGNPRSLYGKGGGVFGLAKLSHLLMEAWMADATLNGNQMVRRWHQSQQKAGFKFLVTQIMGYQTGGPQKYTGRPMDEAHMHLAISPAEWRQFMKIAVDTFEVHKVPAAARRELLEIIAGFEQQCVLPPGRAAPPDPGMPRAHPSSLGTAYHRLGGVYPIAHFADALVDRLVAADSPVKIPFDAIDAAESTRHSPGLKYVLTELLCHQTGGPEIITAEGFDDAKLGVPMNDWAAFSALAADVASVFPTPHHRAMILAVINEHKPELCHGHIEDGGISPERFKRLKIEKAGFESFDAVAALAKAGGDQERAIQMLVDGWVPDAAASAAAKQAMDVSETAAAAADGPKCPFGFTGPNPHGPQAAAPALPAAIADTVKVMAERGGLDAEAIAKTLNLDVEKVKATLAPPPPEAEGVVKPLDEPLASAAKTMAERGIDPEQIATMLNVSAAAVKATVHAGAGGDGNTGGKVVGNPMQQRLDQLLEEDANLCCPVTLVLFVDPVNPGDGFAYERNAAEELAQGDKFVSPMTREERPFNLEPAHDIKEKAKMFRIERCDALVAFIAEAAPVNAHMAMEAVERVSEYLAALPPADVASVSAPTSAACDAMLRLAHSVDNPQGTWHAKPAEVRRVNGLKLQVTAGGGADLRQLTCLVCFDDYPALKGIECNAGGGEAGGSAAHAKAEKHFLCDECLAGHVSAAIDAESIDIFRRKGGVCCVDPGCEAPPFTDAALAKALPEEVFAKYTTAKEKIAEQRINAELEKGFEARLKNEREKAGGGQRQIVKDHICEKILTLACPRCGQAFVDFNGCMALTCSRAGCGCGFCALCQEDCGNDAHKHIGDGCPLAQRLGVKKGEFHLSAEDWNKAASKARVIRLSEYLATLTTAQKQHALEDVANELRDLKINPNDIDRAAQAGPPEQPRRGRQRGFELFIR